jgi:hypothetical protein
MVLASEVESAESVYTVGKWRGCRGSREEEDIMQKKGQQEAEEASVGKMITVQPHALYLFMDVRGDTGAYGEKRMPPWTQHWHIYSHRHLSSCF